MTWTVTPEDVDAIAIGGGILGAGGGGNPERGRLKARLELAAGRRFRVERLEDLPAEALIISVGGMGAPSVGLEKLGRGDEAALAVRALARRLGIEPAAVVPIEVGGGNSIGPLIAGGQLNLPTVDADGMGRAFPEHHMISYFFDGTASPCAVMVDSRHRQITFERIPGSVEQERILRAMVVQLGGSAQVANAPLTVARMREVAIPGTLRQARDLGEAVLEAQRTNQDPVAAICRSSGGRRLFSGKVIDVDRRTERGFNVGRLRLGGIDACRGRTAEIELQNEFLILRLDGRVEVTVPDIIALVDGERGLPLTTEVVRYGLRAEVLGIPAPAALKTPLGLSRVGPRVFGYDLDFRPLEAA